MSSNRLLPSPPAKVTALLRGGHPSTGPLPSRDREGASFLGYPHAAGTVSGALDPPSHSARPIHPQSLVVPAATIERQLRRRRRLRTHVPRRRLLRPHARQPRAHRQRRRVAPGRPPTLRARQVARRGILIQSAAVHPVFSAIAAGTDRMSRFAGVPRPLARPSTPILLIHGLDDRRTPPSNTRRRQSAGAIPRA
jgi:pimeloyl-ACP methyl ester carboxylesterase